MTGKELAEGLGISQGMVSRLVKRGMPTDTLERAKRWRNRHMERPRMKGIRADTRPVPTLQPGNTAAAPAPDTALELFDERDEGERAFDEFRKARDRREHFAALSAQMAYEREAGLLMVADEVRAVISQMGTEFRLRLEQWPYVLAPVLAHMTDEAEIRAYLDREVENLLDGLSRHFETLSRQP